MSSFFLGCTQQGGVVLHSKTFENHCSNQTTEQCGLLNDITLSNELLGFTYMYHD